MDDRNSLEKIKSVIDNNTFTIKFYKAWTSSEKPQKVIGENGTTITGVVEEKDWKGFRNILNKHQGMKKNIIKIEIGGDASMTKNGFIVGTSLSKSRFLDLLRAIDLNNCILIIENNTCFGICALPEQACAVCQGKCSEDDKIENVVRDYMKENKIDNNTFYLGNRYNNSLNDPTYQPEEQYGADYMQRIEGDKCDTFDIYEKNATGQNGRDFARGGKKIENNENKYYLSLYQDLQKLLSKKKELPKPEDKEVSPKNNGAKTDLAISATTKPEENNTQTNNEGALCDLKSGICCGCKWW